MHQVVTQARGRQLTLAVLFGSLCLFAPVLLAQGQSEEALEGTGSRLGSEIVMRARGSDVPPLTTGTGDHAIFLPLVTHNYRLFVNGDFEDGFQGWEARRGPFSGHGSGLPQSVVVFDGGKRALLGESGDLPSGSIPVGYGSLAQTFTLQTPYVRLRYWVFSYDKAKGEERYFDTFEVSLNRPPDQVWDGEREARGCATTLLNPQGTLNVAGDGLLFCGGRPGTLGQGTLWDSGGWRTVTLDLRGWQGTSVTLYFAIWSREHESPFYDDRAWFNTWAYVDDVQPTSSVN